MSDKDRLLAEKVRAACLAAAQAAYEDAGLSGLCAEGRWEIALDAICSLDLESCMANDHDTSSTKHESG